MGGGEKYQGGGKKYRGGGPRYVLIPYRDWCWGGEPSWHPKSVFLLIVAPPPQGGRP